MTESDRQGPLTTPSGAPDNGGMSNDVDELLRAAHEHEPGWSARWGGPVGVLSATAEELREVEARRELLLDLRAAAIREALRSLSLADVGALLGLRRQSVHEANRRADRGAFSDLGEW